MLAHFSPLHEALVSHICNLHSPGTRSGSSLGVLLGLTSPVTAAPFLWRGSCANVCGWQRWVTPRPHRGGHSQVSSEIGFIPRQHFLASSFYGGICLLLPFHVSTGFLSFCLFLGGFYGQICTVAYVGSSRPIPRPLLFTGVFDSPPKCGPQLTLTSTCCDDGNHSCLHCPNGGHQHLKCDRCGRS